MESEHGLTEVGLWRGKILKLCREISEREEAEKDLILVFLIKTCDLLQEMMDALEDCPYKEQAVLGVVALFYHCLGMSRFFITNLRR